jgi:hypothetical protein
VSALCAGIDLSTSTIHAALIALDPDTHLEEPLVLRHADLPKQRDDARFDGVLTAVRDLLRPTAAMETVELVYIERPMGRHIMSVAPLMAIYGAIRASIPRHIPRDALAPSEWRRELGLPARLSKADAIREARDWVYRYDRHYHVSTAQLDEHYADALLVALAGRQRNYRLWAEGAA